MRLQVQSGQEVKTKITAKNWQQQLCLLFPQKPRTPNQTALASDSQTAASAVQQTRPDGSTLAGDNQMASDTQNTVPQAATQTRAQSVKSPVVASDAQMLSDAGAGYWMQVPAVRLKMLWESCHAALDSYIMR